MAWKCSRWSAAEGQHCPPWFHLLVTYTEKQDFPRMKFLLCADMNMALEQSMAGGVNCEVQCRDDINKPFATLPHPVTQKNMTHQLGTQICSLPSVPCCKSQFCPWLVICSSAPHTNSKDEIGLCSVPGERGLFMLLLKVINKLVFTPLAVNQL